MSLSLGYSHRRDHLNGIIYKRVDDRQPRPDPGTRRSRVRSSVVRSKGRVRFPKEPRDEDGGDVSSDADLRNGVGDAVKGRERRWLGHRR